MKTNLYFDLDKTLIYSKIELKLRDLKENKL